MPNIVYILADDMAMGDLGCYNPNSKIATPRLDALATQGARFTDAHTPDAVCSPSRYGFLTGRYCWRTRLKTNVLLSWAPPLIEEQIKTLPQMLREAGYATACIGKWHLGLNWLSKDGSEPDPADASGGSKIIWDAGCYGGPLDHGFDYYFGVNTPGQPPYTFIENRNVTVTPTVPKAYSISVNMFGEAGLMAPDWDSSQILPTCLQKTLDYINGRAGNPQPFFLYVPLAGPHLSIAPTPEWVGTSQAGRYGDYCQELDAQVGAILDALEANGFGDDTLVVFTSDNGGLGQSSNTSSTSSLLNDFGHDQNLGFRGDKGDIWEGGHRIPTIIRWPGQITAGTVNDNQISSIDWLRTIERIAGLTPPTPGSLAIPGADSFDMLPALTGAPVVGPERVNWVYHGKNGEFAVRDATWKWCKFPDSTVYLFRVANFPSETTSVDNATVKSDMQARLIQIKNTGATYGLFP